MMQSLSLGMFKFGHWMGLISQVTSEIKIDPYAKTADRGGQFSGGNSLLHGSDIILEWSPAFNGDFILDNPKGRFNDSKTKPIGQNVKVTMGKVTLEAYKRTQVVYPIKYGRKPSGIWKEREVADLIMAFGLAKLGGSWISFTPQTLEEIAAQKIEDVPEKVQGLDNLYELLEENQPLCDYYFKKFSQNLI